MGLYVDRLVMQLKDESRIYIAISFGIFGFILFFQPFPIEKFDFNNGLIFMSGFGVINLIALLLIRGLFSTIFQKFWKSLEKAVPNFTGRFFLFLFTATAFTFYLRYVGNVGISFFIVAKIIVLAMVSPVTFWRYDQFVLLKKAVVDAESELSGSKINAVNNNTQAREPLVIDLISEKGTEKLSMESTDIAFIKSADNYVEVVYKEGDHFRNKLLRNTLTNIEHQIIQNEAFVRCHRGYIVNLIFVEKMSRRLNNYFITIRGYSEQLPVARQYLLKIKELISHKG